MRADAATTAAVRALIERLSAACEQRDVERALACFITREDVVLVGSGVAERADGRTQLRALLDGLLAQFSLRWTWDRCEVWSRDSLAWAMLEGAFHARGDRDENVSGPYRLCAVLEHDSDTWRIALFHGSEPSLTGSE
jgi:uncharacterized protein (TIGR02246 family)